MKRVFAGFAIFLLVVFSSESLVFAAKDKNNISKKEEEIRALLGEAQMISKDYEGSEEQYRTILKSDPGNLKARVSLADILGWQKKYDEAVSEYEKALNIAPDDLSIKEKLAKVYAWKGDYKKSEDLYKDIISKNPENTAACASLAEVLTWDKRYDEAIQYYDLAISKEEDEGMKLLFGRALLFAGDYKRAEEIFQEIIDKNPDNLEAKISLADTYSYNKQFKKGISLYEDVLKKEDNLEVKVKMADVLSWDKQYTRAFKLYDEILNDPKISEKDYIETGIQNARVLGWARKYRKSIKEYQKVLSRKYDEGTEFEMKAKKAYFDNRVKGAIRDYKRLIEKEPKNVEAMFDLSQIYSYQSMWTDAVDEYDRILTLYPNHFRAKEGLEKAELISKHLYIKTGYRFLEGYSTSRIDDVRKHTYFSDFSYPIRPYLRLDLNYELTSRSFRDFKKVLENEGKIKLTYRRNPDFWIDGFYDFIAYSKNIDTMHEFGGSANARFFDIGIASFSYERQRLENSSHVIIDNFYSDDFKGRLYFDINKRIKFGIDHLYATYSDGNYKNEPGFDTEIYLSFEPKRLTIKHRYFYRQFEEKSPDYFSPKGFTTNTLTVNWRHYLNKEEIFFGANDIYYELQYDLSVDSEHIVGHKFSGKINWDINKRLNFNMGGSFTNSSAQVYKDRSIESSLKYYF